VSVHSAISRPNEHAGCRRAIRTCRWWCAMYDALAILRRQLGPSFLARASGEVSEEGCHVATEQIRFLG
jgi:hypothetical protein